MSADGKKEWAAIGYVVETDYGGGNIARDFEILTSVLNPVLFQQVKPFTGKSAYILIEGVDFTKRFKAPNGAAPKDEPPDTSADVGHEEG